MTAAEQVTIHKCHEPGCGKLFPSQQTLAGHKKAHGVKNAVCEWCGARGSKAQIGQHRRYCLKNPDRGGPEKEKIVTTEQASELKAAVEGPVPPTREVYEVTAKDTVTKSQRGPDKKKRKITKKKCEFCGRMIGANNFTRHLKTHPNTKVVKTEKKRKPIQRHRCPFCRRLFKTNGYERHTKACIYNPANGGTPLAKAESKPPKRARTVGKTSVAVPSTPTPADDASLDYLLSSMFPKGIKASSESVRAYTELRTALEWAADVCRP